MTSCHFPLKKVGFSRHVPGVPGREVVKSTKNGSGEREKQGISTEYAGRAGSLSCLCRRQLPDGWPGVSPAGTGG